MKKFCTKLLIFCSFLLPLSACQNQDDDLVNDRQFFLQDWGFYSWTEDGTELIGSDKQFFFLHMEFFADNTMEWRQNSTSGQALIQQNDWQIASSLDLLTLTNPSGTQIEFAYEIDAENLKLEGNLGGAQQIMQARPR